MFQFTIIQINLLRVSPLGEFCIVNSVITKIYYLKYPRNL